MDKRVTLPLHRNRLANECSPYLLQHAHNPVDWFPWGDEAFARARDEGKPILLSIGYSACHWCHVMAHESFEDEETASLMNRLFINIKVDREERPDLDRIYQNAHQILTQRPGGWPLTLFLDPQQLPFAAGTYFPKEARYGMPPFREVMQRVTDFYHGQPGAMAEQNQALLAALSRSNPDVLLAGEPNDQPLQSAAHALSESYDPHHGGFGAAPKFPHTANLELLLHHQQPELRAMAHHTLRAMAEGGVMDQLAGGFFRYSVDERWEIPHFEKMLYDNGPLLALYAAAWQQQPLPLWRRVTEMTADWVIKEMRSAEGGFYSTLDADSEGEEGRFYLWRPEQVAEVTEPDDYPQVARHFGLDQPANFEGAWHLKVASPLTSQAASGVEQDTLTRAIDRCRERLLTLRSYRTRPDLDRKQLASWNGLMIKGLARAGRLLERSDYIDAASHALDFIRQRMVVGQRLHACYKDGRPYNMGYLDDYAFLLDATLELLQARFRRRDLELAIWLADQLLERFEDRQRGGWFFTANDHEALIHRPKGFSDDSMPSGNGVAAHALLRLGLLLGRQDYLRSGRRCVEAAWAAMGHYPLAHGAMLLALRELLDPTPQLVIRGRGEALRHWQREAERRHSHRVWVIAIPAEETELPGLLAEKRANEHCIAYRCEAGRCSAPISSQAGL